MADRHEGSSAPVPGGDGQRWRPSLARRLRPGVCERCGAVRHVHRGLCLQCRRMEAGGVLPPPAEHVPAPHEAPRRPPRNPPWRRRGA